MENNFFLNIKNIGEEITLKGWVKKIRKLGDLIFIDLRNEDKIIQVLVDSSSKAYEITNSIKNEFVISVFGKIVERLNKNPNIESGNIELKAYEIYIINKSIQSPMIIDDKTDALELKRLEYRYLDLRRNVNQKILRFRSEFNKYIRDFFYSKDFLEIETPIITKPTPGGAGELKVLSQNHIGKYYSLVQSPQIYKQLLMYSGVSKYFQIARCFRDEDSRSDRQLEFTQLDIEMSFINEDKIKLLINELIIKLTKKFNNIDIKEIPIIKYEDAINKYGSDKPDTRFENKIFDLTDIFKNSKIDFIKSLIKKEKLVKGIFFENIEISNSEIKKIEEEFKLQNDIEISWLKINKSISGPLKSISENNLIEIKKTMNIKSNGLLIIVIDKKYNALKIIGRIRLKLAKMFNLINKNKLNYLWVTEFPLFEESNNGQIVSSHNPFTLVSSKDEKKLLSINKIDIKNLLKIKSRSYDLILNGSEIGGGSIRISNFEIQNKIFDLLGISEKEKNNKFGWFIEAQKYGIPEHGGIALGLDRLISILLNKETIRDVIAFPKTTSGTDEMMKAPIDLN